ncbi:MAG: trigger factor [Fusobacteriaceae bacterium]|jgi:trigger factor|nr:trigger factor [Fusobacteriaceae bacterium]
MNHQVKKLPNSAVEMTISLSAEEINPVKTQILNDMKDKVEIKGFRKGKAPLERIEQEYKENVIGQVVEKMLEQHYDTAVKAENIVPISYIQELRTDLKDGGLDMVFQIDVYPEITLGEYKGLSAEKETFVMSDDVLAAELERMQRSKGQLVAAEDGYKAQIGDTLDLAYDGSIDGVPFDGGKSDSHLLKLGSKMFIDTFEDQLVGYTAGQSGEVNVTFPADYHAKELAGKPAVFKVKVNAVKQLKLPEWTDELAGEFGYENLADLKEKKREEVKIREERRVEGDYRGKLLDKIAAETKVEVPFSMIAGEITNRIREMEQQLGAQGIKLESYLKMTGSDISSLEKQIAPMAVIKVRTELILSAIAKNENITVSDEEVTRRMEEIAKYYGTDLEKFKEDISKSGNIENLQNSIRSEQTLEKALDFVAESATPTA